MERKYTRYRGKSGDREVERFKEIRTSFTDMTFNCYIPSVQPGPLRNII